MEETTRQTTSAFDDSLKHPVRVALAESVRRTVFALDSEPAVSAPRTLEDIVGSTTLDRRLMLVALRLFAATGLVLAAIGFYAAVGGHGRKHGADRQEKPRVLRKGSRPRRTAVFPSLSTTYGNRHLPDQRDALEKPGQG